MAWVTNRAFTLESSRQHREVGSSQRFLSLGTRTGCDIENQISRHALGAYESVFKAEGNVTTIQ